MIAEQLPNNVQGLTLTLRPEVINSDYYHYTHGLKLHDGNCQRIAHGHRSKIGIYLNGQRSIDAEHAWCERWRDIYIASEEDQVDIDQIELSSYAMDNVSDQHKYFSYRAPQGRFDIAVMKNQLEIVDCDSTVELLADFIARTLNKQYKQEVKVVAYEGVAKGAIATV